MSKPIDVYAKYAFLGLLLLCLGSFAQAKDASDARERKDLAFLLDGVKQIAAPGIPGPLCVYGDQAFAVVVGRYGSDRAPVVAAARLGKGRIVAFGHNGYFGKGPLEAGETGRFMFNVVRWLAGKTNEKDHSPRVGVFQNQELTAWLQSKKTRAEKLNRPNWLERLGSFDVLYIRPSSPSDQEIKRIAEFVKGGGGLLTGVPGWGWLQLNPGKSLLRDLRGNLVLAQAGMVFAGGYMRRTSDVGFDTSKPLSEFCHAGKALRAVVADSKDALKLQAEALSQISTTTMIACQSIPSEDQSLRPRFRELFEESSDLAIPTPKKPLSSKDNALDRLALTFQLEKLRQQTPEKIRAHPAAAEFPGAVPEDAETVVRSIEIDTNIPNWHSTGLYAPPGQLITVETPDAAAGKGLSVQIGCHTDQLWGKNSWRRAPRITRSFPLKESSTKAANAFGGLVYISVPGNCKPEKIQVKVSGAVEAPYYVLGKTDLEEWRKTIRHRPAPWAELAGDSIIYSVPSDSIRKLDDPEALMKVWDDVMNADADLAGIPRKRRRPERFALDVQISAGYMHSGYPIMGCLDAVYSMDREKVLKGLWGNFHEIGHNHQSGDWTFGGTGEVTCNLFTLYVYDKVCGIPISGTRMSKSKRRPGIIGYFTDGAKFSSWKSNPFLALAMYAQVQEAFGWEAFKKVFAEYRKLPRDQRPKNDDEKRDQWMVRVSRTVGKNLGPFFEAWNVPTSKEARDSIANLPTWMPEDFPPKAPTGFVKEWRLSPITIPWEDTTKFVEINDKKLKRIASADTADVVQSETNQIDFLPLFPQDERENIAAYLVLKFKSERSRNVKIFTGSDDALRLWLNGKLITKVLKMRPVAYDSETTEAAVRAGDNTLLAEVSNGRADWGLCLRFEDDKGKELQVTKDGRLVGSTEQGG